MTFNSFKTRHIGPRGSQLDEMLEVVGSSSLDALMNEAMPDDIRVKNSLNLGEPQTEHDYLEHVAAVAGQNRIFRSFIGMGYYGCVTPSVIRRNMLEDPSWYTPYTPYQAEIAQGRLEALLNFQTMVADLTGMEVSTASLLDESTAAAEAMAMLFKIGLKTSKKRGRFLLSDGCFPQTLEVLRGRAELIGIELQVMNVKKMKFDDNVFGVLLQSPDNDGLVENIGPVIDRAHESDVLVAVSTDLLSLTLIKSPGEMGADVVVGSTQRFGVPMGYGGPHAAFFSTREKFVRQAPGRIIGVSVDVHGNRAYRMALQTREQHIKRERATSNICTAQALLAMAAGFYAVFHGPKELIQIARKIHELTRFLNEKLRSCGYKQSNKYFFDTLKIELPKVDNAWAKRINESALAAEINFRYFEDGSIGISLDETTSIKDVWDIVEIFAGANGIAVKVVDQIEILNDGPLTYPGDLTRRSSFLTHKIFNTHHSETQMMRYLRSLKVKDIGLDTSMIPLGSCTMKLNAAAEMTPVTWSQFANIHPFVPTDQAKGYMYIVKELEAALCDITGLSAVSLQPNSGAQGEFAGLAVIRAYHRERGEEKRNLILIPASAHGTNPASATMAGMRVAVVVCDSQGNVDVDDLKTKCIKYQDELAGLMVTYPSTHGVFEERIREICGIVHNYGGQVYMDGANMNAQVGLVSPARIGVDVAHLNLHKTFAIPHGGGGPGMGPIAVEEHLAPYLPSHPVVSVGSDRAIHAVSGAPWGSGSILLVSYGYIKMLGGSGVSDATKYAILNANYIKSRLENYYDVLYTRTNGRVAHEMIFDLRPFKKESNIDEQDVAKRLMDYGFHAPTVSFPVPGTMMIEPTESESKEEIDRFCEAMIAVRAEIQAVIEGKSDGTDNVLKNAPHTAEEATRDNWTHPYSREEAVYPLSFVRTNKFWPSVGRIDNAYGDRNLICACLPIDAYTE